MPTPTGCCAHSTRHWKEGMWSLLLEVEAMIACTPTSPEPGTIEVVPAVEGLKLRRESSLTGVRTPPVAPPCSRAGLRRGSLRARRDAADDVWRPRRCWTSIGTKPRIWSATCRPEAAFGAAHAEARCRCGCCGVSDGQPTKVFCSSRLRPLVREHDCARRGDRGLRGAVADARCSSQRAFSATTYNAHAIAEAAVRA